MKTTRAAKAKIPIKIMSFVPGPVAVALWATRAGLATDVKVALPAGNGYS